MKLIDKGPDGSMRFVTDGSHRVKIGEIIDSHVSVTVEMMDTAYVFFPGHQIQIALTHSNFPAIAPNPDVYHIPEAAIEVLTGRNFSCVDLLIIE